VENQHRAILGERDYSVTDVALINQIRELERQTGALWSVVYGQPVADVHSLDQARIRLQEGFTWLEKGVARPQDMFVGFLYDAAPTPSTEQVSMA
jgi:hypothetical protein